MAELGQTGQRDQSEWAVGTALEIHALTTTEAEQGCRWVKAQGRNTAGLMSSWTARGQVQQCA